MAVQCLVAFVLLVVSHTSAHDAATCQQGTSLINGTVRPSSKPYDFLVNIDPFSTVSLSAWIEVNGNARSNNITILKVGKANISVDTSGHVVAALDDETLQSGTSALASNWTRLTVALRPGTLQMTVESPMHYYQGNVLLDYAHPQGGQEGLAVAVLPQAEISLSDVSVVTSDDPSLVVACSAPPGYEYLLQTGGNSAPSKSESDNHLAVWLSLAALLLLAILVSAFMYYKHYERVKNDRALAALEKEWGQEPASSSSKSMFARVDWGPLAEPKPDDSYTSPVSMKEIQSASLVKPRSLHSRSEHDREKKRSKDVIQKADAINL